MSASWATSTPASSIVTSRASDDQVQHPVHPALVASRGEELVQLRAPARVRGAFTGLDEPDEQAARQRLVRRVEGVDGAVGSGGDGALHAAGGRCSPRG